jgi:hypothetical protein
LNLDFITRAVGKNDRDFKVCAGKSIGDVAIPPQDHCRRRRPCGIRTASVRARKG